ncbi:MAG: hypothetical protein KGI90_12840 [Burkholderiales bacterium]|nr:hypothetical protein [Burkholderiales bacterium]
MPPPEPPTPSPAPAPPAAASFWADPTPARLPQRLRRRLAALGLVGALMVALPLVQLLRFQNASEADLLQARTRLDPVGRTVAVERSLLAHRHLADRLLGGPAGRQPDHASTPDRELEALRAQRQADVDQRIAALMAALVGGGWQAAVVEAQALQHDWSRLAAEVQAHRIDATQSDHAHRLLIEHCLQVIDLLGNEARAALLQRQHRIWLVAAVVALLTLVATGLLGSVRRGLHALAGAAAPGQGPAPRGATDEAGRLLQRLRAGPETVPSAVPSAAEVPHAAPQPTLPGPL